VKGRRSFLLGKPQHPLDLVDVAPRNGRVELEFDALRAEEARTLERPVERTRYAAKTVV